MKRALVLACCLTVLGCTLPPYVPYDEPARPPRDKKEKQNPKQRSERQVRKEELRRSLNEFSAYLDSIGTVGLVTPDVVVYEMTAGGIGEIIEEWSDQASGQFTETLTQTLKTRNIAVKPVRAEAADDARMTSVKYLFRAISDNLDWNTNYRKAVCRDVQVCPDYSLGPLDHLFKDPDVQALFFVLAYNDIPAPEPPALSDPPAPGSERVATAPDPEAAARAPRRRKNRSYAMINGKAFATGTYVSMALVDRQGTIIWYGGKATRKGADLRQRAGVEDMTGQVLGLLFGKENK
jgi:hypothetical protein